MLPWVERQYEARHYGALFLWIAAASVVTGILGAVVLAGPLRWVVPFLHAAAVYPVFVAGVRRTEVWRTAGWMCLWAALLSLVTIALVIVAPERAEQCILNSTAYWDEMHTWATTGVGPEGEPSLFIPIHARHFTAFSVLSFASGGALSLVFGAYLLDYMNYYVGMLVLAADHHGLAYLMGWHIWAVVRVVGYIVLGSALAVFLWRRKVGLRENWHAVKAPLLTGVILIELDIILKTVLADWWQIVLAGVLK